MKSFLNRLSIATFVLAISFSLISPPHAHALTKVSALGGISFVNALGFDGSVLISPVFLAGAEFTFGLTNLLDLGLFYEQNVLGYADQTSGTLRFLGLVARVTINHATPFFVDGKLGYTQSSQNIAVSNLVVGTGVGVGYKFSIGPFAELCPRVGVRFLPALISGVGTTSTYVDTGLLLSMGF